MNSTHMARIHDITRMQGLAVDAPSPASVALEALADRLGLGMLLAEASGAVVFANGRALALLCGSSVDVQGALARWGSIQSDLPCAKPGADPVSFTLDLPSGEVAPRMLRGQCRVLEGGITEYLLADRRALGELDLELLCASRMKEWVHQCEGLVHDANGALNTIQLTLELLDGQWPGPRAGEQVREPHRRNHVGVIRDNLDKLKTTLRQLLAAHDETKVGAYEVGEVVKEASATLKMPARRKRIELQVGTIDAQLRTQGNRARLRQALVNVALCRLEMLPERAEFRIDAVREPDGRVALVCSDSGSLSLAARAGIFQLLMADSGAGSCTDSLRLARAIVESEGGEFHAESSDQGTRLRLVLPPVS